MTAPRSESTVAPYEPPVVETIVTADALRREVQYAGVGSIPDQGNGETEL